MIISSEFCDVDPEHDGPAVHDGSERAKFLCSGCWQKKYPETKFPLAKDGE